MKITSASFAFFQACPTKCYLRSRGERGTGNPFADWMAARHQAYRTNGIQRLIASCRPGECVAGHGEAVAVDQGQWRLAVDCTASGMGWESELDALERCAAPKRGKGVQLVPIRFSPAHQATVTDKLLLAFDAVVLARMAGGEIPIGKLIHGALYTPLTVRVMPLEGAVR